MSVPVVPQSPFLSLHAHLFLAPMLPSGMTHGDGLLHPVAQAPHGTKSHVSAQRWLRVDTTLTALSTVVAMSTSCRVLPCFAPKGWSKRRSFVTVASVSFWFATVMCTARVPTRPPASTVLRVTVMPKSRKRSLALSSASETSGSRKSSRDEPSPLTWILKILSIVVSGWPPRVILSGTTVVLMEFRGASPVMSMVPILCVAGRRVTWARLASVVVISMRWLIGLDASSLGASFAFESGSAIDAITNSLADAGDGGAVVAVVVVVVVGASSLHPTAWSHAASQLLPYFWPLEHTTGVCTLVHAHTCVGAVAGAAVAGSAQPSAPSQSASHWLPYVLVLDEHTTGRYTVLQVHGGTMVVVVVVIDAVVSAGVRASPPSALIAAAFASEAARVWRVLVAGSVRWRGSSVRRVADASANTDDPKRSWIYRLCGRFLLIESKGAPSGGCSVADCVAL